MHEQWIEVCESAARGRDGNAAAIVLLGWLADGSLISGVSTTFLELSSNAPV